jgi:hypothetical protein
MEHITFDFLLGFLLAVGLMVALWVPLFFFDFRAEKPRGAEPVGSGENPPTPPLDKVHTN